MQMQKAEIVPGMLFRERRVYLEQKGESKTEVDADIKSAKQDCIDFALTIRKLCDVCNQSGNLIIAPPYFVGKFRSEYDG